MTAITKEHLLVEKAANQEAASNLRGRLATLERQVELTKTELNALAGAAQMVDHLLARLALPDEKAADQGDSSAGDGGGE